MKKKNSKEKYDNLKADGQAYEELVSEYEREEMPDYSFKSSAQAMGRNAKKLRRIKLLRTVLSVIGAVLVLYFGYFVVALIKGVNSREQSTTAQHVEISTTESTTVPLTENENEQTTLAQTTQAEDTSL